MKIQHYLNLLDSLPLEAIWRRFKKYTWQFSRRIWIKIIGFSKVTLHFQRDLIPEISDEISLIKRIKHGPYPAFFINDQKKDWMANQFRVLCPGEDQNVMKAANLACQHVFNLLGSESYELGETIDWHIDFKSRHCWNEKTFYRDLKPAQYPGGYDIKVPWELSRCQHFAWLGQAYWLSGDETYAIEFCAQVENWTTSNRPQLGVNWVCTMDVGIRAVNWLWGYAYFRNSPSLSNEFHMLFYRSLLEHGRHIMHNLEYSESLTSNHYLSNLVGLIYMGFLLPEFKEAKKWREFGLKELESEMFKQVYPDGINFEASTNYHRLATELFLSATILAQLHGKQFSDEYIERLERMVDVLGSLIKPDGTTPIIGDQDNGRLHRLKVWENPILEWTDFRQLFFTGKVWSQKSVGIQVDFSNLTEAFWLMGPEAIHKFEIKQQSARPMSNGSVFYPDGGWAVMRDHDNYLMIDVGQVGQNDIGGHSHNDSLSIEVFSDGQSWIIDPGTFIYTYDYLARHTFRQTKAHNTIYIPGMEQSLIDEKFPFEVTKPSKTNVFLWESNVDFSLIVAEVEYASIPAITHRRVVIYIVEAQAWLIADQVIPEEKNARIHMTFPSGINVREIDSPYPGIQLSNNEEKSFCLYSLQGGKPEITQCWVSGSYGVKQESFQAEFLYSGNPNHLWVLLPENTNDNSENRINVLLSKWKLTVEKLYS